MVQELGREPTVDEIAERLDLAPARVHELRKIALSPISLQTPVGEDGDASLEDFLVDESMDSPIEVVFSADLKEQTAKVLKSLSQREEQIVRMRFGLDDEEERTLEEVGNAFDVTRERIRQIESKALRRLRHPTRAQKLKPLLDGSP